MTHKLVGAIANLTLIPDMAKTSRPGSDDETMLHATSFKQPSPGVLHQAVRKATRANHSMLDRLMLRLKMPRAVERDLLTLGVATRIHSIVQTPLAVSHRLGIAYVVRAAGAQITFEIASLVTRATA